MRNCHKNLNLNTTQTAKADRSHRTSQEEPEKQTKRQTGVLWLRMMKLDRWDFHVLGDSHILSDCFVVDTVHSRVKDQSFRPTGMPSPDKAQEDVKASLVLEPRLPRSRSFSIREPSLPGPSFPTCSSVSVFALFPPHPSVPGARAG